MSPETTAEMEERLTKTEKERFELISGMDAELRELQESSSNAQKWQTTPDSTVEDFVALYDECEEFRIVLDEKVAIDTRCACNALFPSIEDQLHHYLGPSCEAWRAWETRNPDQHRVPTHVAFHELAHLKGIDAARYVLENASSAEREVILGDCRLILRCRTCDDRFTFPTAYNAHLAKCREPEPVPKLLLSRKPSGAVVARRSRDEAAPIEKRDAVVSRQRHGEAAPIENRGAVFSRRSREEAVPIIEKRAKKRREEPSPSTSSADTPNTIKRPRKELPYPENPRLATGNYSREVINRMALEGFQAIPLMQAYEERLQLKGNADAAAIATGTELLEYNQTGWYSNLQMKQDFKGQANIHVLFLLAPKGEAGDARPFTPKVYFRKSEALYIHRDWIEAGSAWYDEMVAAGEVKQTTVVAKSQTSKKGRRGGARRKGISMKETSSVGSEPVKMELGNADDEGSLLVKTEEPAEGEPMDEEKRTEESEAFKLELNETEGGVMAEGAINAGGSSKLGESTVKEEKEVDARRKEEREQTKKKKEEEDKKKAEEEMKRKEEVALLKAKEEKKSEEAEGKRKAEEEAKKNEEEEKKRKVEEEAKKKAEEEMKRKAEEEAKKKKEEEERKRKAEEEAKKRKEVEEARVKEEEAARRKKEEEEAKKRASEEAQKKAEEEERKKIEEEEEAKKKAEEDARRRSVQLDVVNERPDQELDAWPDQDVDARVEIEGDEEDVDVETISDEDDNSQPSSSNGCYPYVFSHNQPRS